MKLSVIIVNFNVKHFLEQCLISVDKALKGIDGEIIVVDNNSVDGSCRMILEKFPAVKLIKNDTNTGFSKANNQGIQQAKGEYILLLNPDTLVEQDCFTKCLAFMDKNPKAGALGVKMIDGKGDFLPESKRGLPTPWVAFCKIFGLTKIFPHSKKFARYYLGHLPEESVNEVEILAGAFMFLRQSTLEKTGLLDETFFMYGEDIDLSYRITLQGFKNYYFPKTTIVHYKGESTKKGSLNYVKMFYKAMLIFSKKHFSNRQTGLFNFTINLAIYIRALLSATNRVFTAVFLPLLDALFIFLGFYILIPLWETFQFEAGHFPPEFLQLMVPIYAAIWLICNTLLGAYSKPISLKKLVQGILAGSLGIMLTYSFLDESWRFSRALILLGSTWAFISLPLVRFLLNKSANPAFKLKGYKPKKILLMATPDEATRIETLLQGSNTRFELTGFISPNEELPGSEYLGKYSQIREIVQVHKPDELIFSGKDVSSGEIIDYMLDLNKEAVHFKIAPPESLAIIGSHSPKFSGELLQIEANPLSGKFNQLLKRWLDLKVAILLLLLYPVLFWTFTNPKGLRDNCRAVLSGQKTWIGFANPPESDFHLPKIKPGILTPSSPQEKSLSAAKKLEKDRLYAKNYRLLTDLEFIFRNWKNLGQ
ncbi:glycosyltransferase family 2 protein [Mangrovibacterium lignilyticum]|uniref:glycosyltransferase family 2 protein n=1 Tax=Mangrovibacterium lignilyticum TaxID=2668052 RepID=UPI0013CF5EC0|nr:glycosyltransferase [Mangrovibacterium lignilyticum]